MASDRQELTSAFYPFQSFGHRWAAYKCMLASFVPKVLFQQEDESSPRDR